MTLLSGNCFFLAITLLLLSIFGSTACYSQEVPKYKYDVRKRFMGGTILECLGWEPKMFFEQPDMIAACQAVQDRDLQQLREFQEKNIDWNVQGKEGVTVLFWALIAGDFSVYEQLLKWGADPNLVIRIPYGISLGGLVESIRERDTVTFLTIRILRNPQWLESTLAHSTEIKQVEHSSGLNLLSALLFYRDRFLKEELSVIQNLIDAGIDVNQLTSDGRSPVVIAFNSNQPFATVLLIEQGASVDCYDKNDWQLIHHMAGLDISREEKFAAHPEFRDDWNQSDFKKAWDQTVKLLAERGHSLVDAKIDFHRRFETVDGIPYMKWRRMMRNDKDPCVPKSKKPAVSPAGAAKTAPEPKPVSPPKIPQAN